MNTKVEDELPWRDAGERRVRKVQQYASTERKQKQLGLADERCSWLTPGQTQVRDLLAVGYPDVFYLGRVLKKPAAFGRFGIEPINGAALVRPDLFEIAR
jgi:hypothetical protein